MKNFLFIITLVFANIVTAAPITFSAGDYKFTGDAFIDPAEVPGDGARGIGRVQTIQQGSTIIWSSGDGGNYLHYVFDDFITVSTSGFSFVANGGWVKFYITTDATVFDSSLNSVAAMAAISGSGDLVLSAVAYGDTFGIVTPTSYSSNGYLNVVDDPVSTDDYYFNTLNTNLKTSFDGTMTDMSFGLTGNINDGTGPTHPDFKYIASGDLQGTANPVPEPGILMLLGIGLVGIHFTASVKRKLITA